MRVRRASPIVTHETLGLTLDGRAIDALRFGEPGVWTPEPRAAGLSPADAAAVVASTASAAGVGSATAE